MDVKTNPSVLFTFFSFNDTIQLFAGEKRRWFGLENMPYINYIEINIKIFHDNIDIA